MGFSERNLLVTKINSSTFQPCSDLQTYSKNFKDKLEAVLWILMIVFICTLTQVQTAWIESFSGVNFQVLSQIMLDFSLHTTQDLLLQSFCFSHLAVANVYV